MNKQMVHRVYADGFNGATKSLNDLNDLLQSGWSVVYVNESNKRKENTGHDYILEYRNHETTN